MPASERFGSSAALVGGFVLVPALFALVLSGNYVLSLVFSLVAWFSWPIGVILLERLWGFRRLDFEDMYLCGALFGVWAVFAVLDWSVGTLLRSIGGFFVPPGFAAMIVGGIAGGLMGFGMAFVLSGDKSYSEDECGELGCWLGGGWGQSASAG